MGYSPFQSECALEGGALVYLNTTGQAEVHLNYGSNDCHLVSFKESVRCAEKSAGALGLIGNEAAGSQE